MGKRAVPNVKEPEKEATGLEVEVENMGVGAPGMESEESPRKRQRHPFKRTNTRSR